MTELTGMPTTISGQPRTEMNMNPHYKPQEGHPQTTRFASVPWHPQANGLPFAQRDGQTPFR